MTLIKKQNITKLLTSAFILAGIAMMFALAMTTTSPKPALANNDTPCLISHYGHNGNVDVNGDHQGGHKINCDTKKALIKFLENKVGGLVTQKYLDDFYHKCMTEPKNYDDPDCRDWYELNEGGPGGI